MFGRIDGRAAGAVAGIAVTLAGPAARAGTAAKTSYPTMVASMDTLLESDNTYHSTVPRTKLSDTYLYADARAGLFFNRHLALRTTLTLEPMRTATSSRQFHSEGAFIEELNLKWERGPLVVYGGKFDPGFGLAGNDAPGLYGADFAGDYQIREAIGGGASYAIDAKALGTMAVGGAAFFLDNTILSNSYFSKARFGQSTASRYRAMRGWYGGVGNTYTPNSYTLVLDGYRIPSLPGLKYQIGWDDLHHGQDGSRDQDTLVVGAEYTVRLARGISFFPIAEYARIHHVGGAQLSNGQPQDQDARYVNAGVAFRYHHWTLSGMREYRWNLEPDNGTGPDGFSNLDREVTASLGYVFSNGIGLAVGWKRAYSYNTLSSMVGSSDTWGAQSSYSIDF
jgi:hypothetical protein